MLQYTMLPQGTHEHCLDSKCSAPLPCRDFTRATQQVIREASHADKSGNASFLGAIRHCCLGLCSSAKDTMSGTKDHVSLCTWLTSIRQAPHCEISSAMAANI